MIQLLDSGSIIVTKVVLLLPLLNDCVCLLVVKAAAAIVFCCIFLCLFMVKLTERVLAGCGAVPINGIERDRMSRNGELET